MKQRKFVVPPQIIERLERIREGLVLSVASKPDVEAIGESQGFASAVAATNAYKADVRARIQSLQEVVSDLEIVLANHFRPPINAEYLLHLVLGKKEREAVIGDLIQEYRRIMQRFGRRNADIWFCKQVISSLWPFLRRAIVRLGTLFWVGRLLRRLIP